MAGYNYDLGMSNRAVRAYSFGIKPLSRFSKEDFVDAEIEISKSFAIWLAKKGFWPSTEWHHSGGTWYNEVDFYNIRNLQYFLDNKKHDIENLRKKYLEEKKLEKEIKKLVFGYYIIKKSYYCRRRWNTGWQTIENKVFFVGEKKGDWIYIDDKRKKASSYYVYYWELNKKEISDFLDLYPIDDEKEKEEFEILKEKIKDMYKIKI